MALRPGNYGNSLGYAAWMLGLSDVNDFKGVVFKVNNNKPPSSARRRLLFFERKIQIEKPNPKPENLTKPQAPPRVTNILAQP